MLLNNLDPYAPPVPALAFNVNAISPISLSLQSWSWPCIWAGWPVTPVSDRCNTLFKGNMRVPTKRQKVVMPGKELLTTMKYEYTLYYKIHISTLVVAVEACELLQNAAYWAAAVWVVPLQWDRDSPQLLPGTGGRRGQDPCARGGRSSSGPRAGRGLDPGHG